MLFCDGRLISFKDEALLKADQIFEKDYKNANVNMTKLQEILIQKISSTTDVRILHEVNRILETGADEDIYQLTPEQIKGIEESREQIKNGQFFTDEEANKEILEWLKNK